MSALHGTKLGGIETSYVQAYLKNRIPVIRRMIFSADSQIKSEIFVKIEFKTDEVFVVKIPEDIIINDFGNRLPTIYGYLYENIKENYPEFFI
jgi:hypothetical protein